MSAKGILNYNGKPLTLSCLQNALRNTKYIGKYVYGGQEVEGACDAIINEDVFYKVQAMLDSRSHGKNAKRVRQNYLLHGKAFCGYCGALLVGDGGTSKTGVVHHYYACGKRKKYHTCDKINEKKDFLEWYVVEQTVNALARCDIDDLAAEVVASYDNDFNDIRIKKLERQIKKLDVEVDRLVDSIIEMPKKAAAKIGEKLKFWKLKKRILNLIL